MAATTPVFSTVLKAGSRKQKTFSLEKLCLYILEEKLSQILSSPKDSLSRTQLCTLWLLLICKTMAGLAARKPGKVNG